MIDRSRITNLAKPAIATTIRRKEFQIELWSDGAITKGGKRAPQIPSVGYSCIGELKQGEKTIRRIVYYGNMTGEEETSQRGEMMGCIVGLRDVLPALLNEEVTLKNSTVSLFSDSAYCMNSFNGVNGGKAWFINWIRKNWRTASDGEIKNSDLWEQFLPLCTNTAFICAQNKLFNSNHPIAKAILEGSRASGVEVLRFQHVPGHAGIFLNELADRYAVAAKMFTPWDAHFDELDPTVACFSDLV